MTSIKFETQNCSRCGGTGKYSYCQMYGDICFKCKGKKITLTKKGASAYNYFVDLLSKPVKNLEIGDIIRLQQPGYRGIKNIWCQIEKIEPDDSNSKLYINNKLVKQNNLKVKMINKNTGEEIIGIFDVNTKFRLFHSDKSEKLKLALEYQEKLTKKGTVKKKYQKETKNV